MTDPIDENPLPLYSVLKKRSDSPSQPSVDRSNKPKQLAEEAIYNKAPSSVGKIGLYEVSAQDNQNELPEVKFVNNLKVKSEGGNVSVDNANSIYEVMSPVVPAKKTPSVDRSTKPPEVDRSTKPSSTTENRGSEPLAPLVDCSIKPSL